MDVSGFNLGKFSFRYLGIPICYKRISAKDCDSLIEKMSARIRCWGSKHLCYQGRLYLINLVLMSLHVYWAQILIVPRRIL